MNVDARPKPPTEDRRTRPAPPRRRFALGLLAALLLAGGVGGVAWWSTHRGPAIPPGIAVSNGRLEEDEIDIQTKFAGRVADILVDEGARVTGGQVLARMDVSDMQAQLAKAQADIQQADHVIATAQTDLEQARSVWSLAQAEVNRTAPLVPKGFATQELLDQRHQALDAAIASYNGINARISAATSARESALQSARLIEVNIADNTLRAPRDGIVQYRLANVGEVLAAGGKLFTMLDTNYAYMDIYLPTGQAGKAAIGTEARIVLEARPDTPLPAHVSFIADQNQFTPKMVETAVERDKLMFRIRVRIDPDTLRDPPFGIQAGQPGLAYLRLDPAAAWPAAALGTSR